MKRLTSLLLVFALLLISAGCSTDEEAVTGPSVTQSTSVISSSDLGSEPSADNSDENSEADPEENSEENSEQNSEENSEDNSNENSENSSEENSDENSEQNSEENSDNTSEENSEETSKEEENSSDVNEKPEPAPQWTEKETSGTMYVNTDGIYSRVSAIKGSNTVKKYSLNDKVTVVAVTDTDYYKLSDGTFIHKDYLSTKETPAWTEKAASGTMYVNTNGIYSRVSAIKGSQTVKKYSLNDKVTVVAITDTDYYKLSDGSFIHKDYLSTKEVVVKPSAEQLLNSAPLKPIKTNDPDIDELVDQLLSEIIDDKMSTYEKVVAIYNYIINTSTYNRYPTHFVGTDIGYHRMLDLKIVMNAYTLLKYKEGVCDNYSAMFVVLTRAIGLESYVMMGQVRAKAGGTTGHVWTLMKLNGEYYTFDPQVEQNNLVNGKIMYYYFCRSEASGAGLYTYDVRSWYLAECAYYADMELDVDNPREMLMALFGNFAVDDERKPYNDYLF